MPFKQQLKHFILPSIADFEEALEQMGNQQKSPWRERQKKITYRSSNIIIIIKKDKSDFFFPKATAKI